MTRKEAIEVMERIKKHFLDIHYPLKNSMYDRGNTVDYMFCKALEILKKDKINTLKEALDMILSEMSLFLKEEIKRTPEKELIIFHHSIGRQIRNKLSLWEGNIELAEDMGLDSDTHADEISQKIIEALWKKLNNNS